ncbi:hypothetical protein [Kibdelosporangium aridum]|uniref:hypothetical protein n=1 Tax=Kibdelosporangium aridum TaxID=2030 RepID=UPI0035EE4BFA
MAAGEHLGERADAGRGDFQVRTGHQDLLELQLFLGVELVGVAGGVAPTTRNGAK